MSKIEFISLGKDKYLIKNSNNIIVNKKEKLQIEKDASILLDIESNDCQAENTKKRSKIEKELKEIDKETKN
jgi:hypothetical protein